MGLLHKVIAQLNKPKRDTATAPEPELTEKRLLAQIKHFSALIRLQDERQLIEVIAPKFIDSFQSMIIGVDLYHQQLMIDEFSPKLMAPEALIGHQLELRHQTKRQMLTMQCDVLGWDENTRSLQLSLPKEVHYQPRRRALRLELSAHRVITTTIDPIYGAPWYGSISNISLGGMRILVTGDLRAQLHKNKALRDCSIRLEEHQQIHPAGRVKAFRYHGRPYRHTEISIAFERMNEEDQAVLAGFMRYFEMAA